MSTPYPYRPSYTGYPPAGRNHGNGYSYDPSQAGYWQGHGQFSNLRYQSLTAPPVVWEPFTVYYIRGATERTARHFYTDANGQPFPANDGAFEEWLSRPGNAGKTVAQFVDAITANAAVISQTAPALVSSDASNLLRVGGDGKLYVSSFMNAPAAP